MMHNEQKTREFSSPTPRLASQNDDVQQNIFSFLDVDDVRTMMKVNHRYRRLLVSDEAQELWKEFCRRQWPWLPTEHVQVVDDLHLPTAAVGEDSVQPNFALLLSMAVAKSTSIDESLFETFSNFLPRCPNCQSLVRKAKLETIRTASGEHRAFQCTERLLPVGRICIRADHPLPRPKLLTQGPPRPRRRNEEGQAEAHAAWRPFVAPMVVPSAGSAQMQQPPSQVHLTPRLVSYYEVSIFEAPVALVTTDTRTTATGLMEAETDELCGDDDAPYVVVGLATDEFSLYSHMPGWDSNSYGYHGGEGAIYHQTGYSIRHYGPLFGVGDVVGCGIDYLAGGIFYTLNGHFMGYAFENLSLESLQEDWYPTVGLLNTNLPVQCNFGCEQPFVFDLTTIAAGQMENVLQTMRWNRRDGRET
jgi:hypothetical protein